MKLLKITLIGLAILMQALSSFGEYYATELVSYSDTLTGTTQYNDPNAVIGAPTTVFANFGTTTGRVKLVEPAYNVSPDGNKLITTLNAGQEIVVKFDHQV